MRGEEKEERESEGHAMRYNERNNIEMSSKVKPFSCCSVSFCILIRSKIINFIPCKCFFSCHLWAKYMTYIAYINVCSYKCLIKSMSIPRTCSTEEPAVTAVRHVGDGSLP